MSPTKRILFTVSGGRFANQLLNYAHLAAYTFDNSAEIQLLNLSFWRYRNLFGDEMNDYCMLPNKIEASQYLKLLSFITRKTNFKFYKFFLYLLTYLLGFFSLFSNQKTSIIIGREKLLLKVPGEKFGTLDLASKNFQQSISDNSHVYICGWGARDWASLAKHQAKIRELFQFNQEIADKSRVFLDRIREKYHFVIGFHLRQGDYVNYRGGQFFFESERYRQWMDEALDTFASRGDVAILITSDSLQDKSLFTENNFFFSSGSAGIGHYSLSMMQLSLCDLIIGPPSTFSLWAAFTGNKPILLLESNDQSLNRDSIIIENNFFDALQLTDTFSL